MADTTRRGFLGLVLCAPIAAALRPLRFLRPRPRIVIGDGLAASAQWDAHVERAMVAFYDMESGALIAEREVQEFDDATLEVEFGADEFRLAPGTSMLVQITTERG